MNNNMNMKLSQMKGGNNENACLNTLNTLNTMAGNMNYKNSNNMYSGNNMLYMNSMIGQNLNSTTNPMNGQLNNPMNSQMNNPMNSQMNNPMNNQMNNPMNNQMNNPMNNQMNNPMNNQLNPMGNNMSGGMNSGIVGGGINMLANNVNPTLNTQNNLCGINNKMNENNVNNNIYGDINKNDKINFNNFGMNEYTNNKHMNLKNDEYKYVNTNQDNLLINNTQNKINLINKDVPNIGNNINVHNINIHNDGKMKPFGSNIMNQDVNNNSSNIMPRLNKNLNIFENTKVDNLMKENTYENMFQNTLNNNSNMRNANLVNGIDTNNAMHGINNNMNNFMQGIPGMNKTNVMSNKGSGLHLYSDNILTSLNNKTQDSKMKVFDTSINKLKETDQNNLVNTHMKQNMLLNNFTANQTNNNINNVISDNKFTQMERVMTMNKMQAFNAPPMNPHMGNLHNMNNMNNVNVRGMNTLGNIGGINDPLIEKITNDSNKIAHNNLGSGMLLGNNNNINRITANATRNSNNNTLINNFANSNSNTNKGIDMKNVVNIVSATNNINGMNTEGGLNIFQKPTTSFLNLNGQPVINDNSGHMRDRGTFDYIQSNKTGNDINNMAERNKNALVNDATSNAHQLNQANQLNKVNRNMNMLNNKMNTMGNMDVVSNMHMQANPNNLHGIEMNQARLNQMGMNQLNKNYMNGMMMMNQNEKEMKPVEIQDYRNEQLLNKTNEFGISDTAKQDNMSIDNYANLLKQLCTPVKNRPATKKIETFNESMFNAEEPNEESNAFNHEDIQKGVLKNEIMTEGSNIIDIDKKIAQNKSLEEQMILQNKNEMYNNEYQNGEASNIKGINKEGNIFEIKKLNLFAENKKRDKQKDNENKLHQAKKTKTKVFFYINPKYILEPLKRKIYEKMSFYIENLISDIKAIENKDRSKILEELHATSWFFQVFDFDSISKLLNVFNKYLIYSDSLMIPDALLPNKLEFEAGNATFSNANANMITDRNTNPAISNTPIENNVNGNMNGQMLMMNGDNMMNENDYLNNFNFYFKKNQKLDLLNEKMHDYESNIIENVDKLNYMKELCKNLRSQIQQKKKTFLLLLEKSKLKNFTYKNEHLQAILNIDKKTKLEKNCIILNNEYYNIFKKINEGLNILKGYSQIMVTYPNFVNDILSSESVKIYESTKSSEEGPGKGKVVQIEDGEEVIADSNSVNLSTTNKAKNKRKFTDHNKDDVDAVLSNHNSFEDGEEFKEMLEMEKSKKRKTIKEIKNMHKQMENNEEWVDDFLDDF